jgi:hypothetical protein
MMGKKSNYPVMAAMTIPARRTIRRKSETANSIPTMTIAQRTGTGTPAPTTVFSKGAPASPRLPTECAGHPQQDLIQPCPSQPDRDFKCLWPSGQMLTSLEGSPRGLRYRL